MKKILLFSSLFLLAGAGAMAQTNKDVKNPVTTESKVKPSKLSDADKAKRIADKMRRSEAGDANKGTTAFSRATATTPDAKKKD